MRRPNRSENRADDKIADQLPEKGHRRQIANLHGGQLEVILKVADEEHEQRHVDLIGKPGGRDNCEQALLDSPSLAVVRDALEY